MADIDKMIEVLRLPYGEKIARWCQTPKTTSELRNMYEIEKKKSNIVGVIGPNDLSFDAYLKRLEEAEVIEYKERKWQTTPQGSEVLAKYFG